MKTVTRLTLALLALGIASQPAWADRASRNVATSAGLSASSYSTSNDHKLLQPAQQDASSFVASQGDIRGVHLTAWLAELREKRPDLSNQSDLALAQALLADAL